jgi:hypothetical protein
MLASQSLATRRRKAEGERFATPLTLLAAVTKNACTRLLGACGLVADPSRAIALCRLDQLDRPILGPVSL